MKRLAGRVAVVTGGSRGIGRGMVKALADEGAKVWAIGRDAARLAAVASEIAGVETLAADVTDPQTAGRVLRETRPDILILNAGAAPHMAPIQEQSWEQFAQPWNTDVKATFHFGKEALSMPLAPGSQVVTMSSGAGIAGSPLSGGYAGAKRMQWFMTRYLADESRLLGRGIRFLALLPKQILGDTELGSTAAAAYAARAGITPEQFLERFGAPLTPDGVGQGLIALLTEADYREGLAFGITGKGLERLD